MASSSQHRILATDLDRSVLERARAGGPYAAGEVASVPPVLLHRYFTLRADGYYVVEGLRRQVDFRQHNLLSDSFGSSFDLIVCRNVVIYFTNEAKDRLYRRFCQALRPGGVLFVGGTEIIPKASDIGFETAGISFYRRTAPFTLSSSVERGASSDLKHSMGNTHPSGMHPTGTARPTPQGGTAASASQKGNAGNVVQIQGGN
jgi:SAM-dependent methyltransferase